MDFMHIVVFLVGAVGLAGLVVRWAITESQRRRVLAKTAAVKAEPTSIDLSNIKPLRPNFDWQTQRPIPYRPWNNGPYHVTMGLKPAGVENWIELDDTYLDKYRLKKRLFQEERDNVMGVLPGCDDGLFEGLELLKETLIRQYPSMFRLRNEHTIENLVTGDVWDLRRDASTWEKHHPLEVMSLLATEVFSILYNDQQTGITTLKGAAVCFPAGWKVEERIGQALWGIHAGRVPQYETKLAKSMDRFFMRLKVGSSICRLNYAIDDSGELYHRHSHHNLSLAELGGPPKLEHLHLRVERQVLQRLPKSRALFFTICTYVTPITEVTKDRGIAEALRTSVSSYSDDVAKYKNRSLWEDTLQRHLVDVLGPSETV